MKVKLIVAVIIAVFTSATLVLYLDGENVRTSNEKSYEIEFEALKSKLYVRSRYWGLNGDHQEITVSSIPFDYRKNYSKEDCYFFYTSEIYYKKESADSLTIYVAASGVDDIPKNFSKQIKIKLIELKNHNEVREYELNYKKYGLTRIKV